MAEDPNAALIGALLALVAHDLRNPLSALHSNVGFLESLTSEKDRDAREALADVMASCGSLKHIIDNLELLGLLTQTDRPHLERGPVGLLDVANDAITRIRSIADSYGVTLSLNTGPRRDVKVRAHREMLVRSLGNLVFNSIQHGGSSAPVSLDVMADEKSGLIVCSDGGSLLGEELRDYAFTAEGQLACKSDAFGRYSRGLGLFSARVAADLAGATVKALTPEGGRNRFELRAPLV